MGSCHVSDRLLLLKKNGDGVSDTQGTLGICGNRVPDSLEKKATGGYPFCGLLCWLARFCSAMPTLATNCTIQVSTTSRVSWSPEGNSKSHGIGHCHHDNLYINNVVVYFSKVVKCQLCQVGYYMPKIPLCLSQGSRCIGGGSRHSKCRVCLLFPPVLFFVVVVVAVVVVVVVVVVVLVLVLVIVLVVRPLVCVLLTMPLLFSQAQKQSLQAPSFGERFMTWWRICSQNGGLNSSNIVPTSTICWSKASLSQAWWPTSVVAVIVMVAVFIWL